MRPAGLFVSISIVSLAAAAAEPAGVSDKLGASADEKLAFVLNAQGMQIYSCKPSAKDPYAYAWAFVAPEATLLEKGVSVGRHYAGPTWESSSDRSSVQGAAHDRELARPPDLVGGEDPIQAVDTVDRLAVEFDEEIAAFEARVAGRAILLDRLDAHGELVGESEVPRIPSRHRHRGARDA